jgi:hypothetical protein
MVGLLNNCQFTAAAGGLSDFTVAAAVAGYLTPAQAGATDALTLYYRAYNVTNTEWEIGLGTYTVSGTVWGRTTILYSSNANAKVNFSTAPSVLATFLIGNVPITPPQGRLSLVTGTAVMTSDQTAKGNIYYTACNGNSVPVYDGSVLQMRSFASDLNMILDTSNQLLNNVYDLFAYWTGSALAIGAGPAWSNAATITVTIATPAVVSWTGHGLVEGAPVVFTTSGALPTGITAGTTYFVSRSPGANSFNISTTVANAAAGTLVATSGSQSGTHTGTNHTSVRGTGAGTTELQRINGFWSNKNSITLFNNAVSSGAIAANQAMYLGSFFCTANGQTGVAFDPTPASGGTNNFVGLFNAYNLVRMYSRSRDSAASWTYATTTWRATNNSASNRVTYLDGLAVLNIVARASILADPPASSFAGIGLNRDSTSATPAIQSNCGMTTGGGGDSQYPAIAHDNFLPSLGLHYIQAMEIRAAGSGTITFYSSGYQATYAEFDM